MITAKELREMKNELAEEKVLKLLPVIEKQIKEETAMGRYKMCITDYAHKTDSSILYKILMEHGYEIFEVKGDYYKDIFISWE